MDRLKRLGDILQAFDAYDVFEYYKLNGASALQFLIIDLGFVTNELNFDLDTNLDIKKVNELRNIVNRELPKILQQKNFSLDVKHTQLTGKIDSYAIIDNTTKQEYKLNFNYLNRVHVLNTEYFARKDKQFEDLHIYALSTLENYAKFFVEILEGKPFISVLDHVILSNKIMPQQYPFIKKMVLFYIAISDMKQQINLDLMPLKLKTLLNFNENDLSFLDKVNQGVLDLPMILPPTMASKLEHHPKVKLMRK